MASYNLEKVLYFAKQKGAAGLHVGSRDFNGTTLAGLVKNAASTKFIVLDRAKATPVDRYYNITRLGELALKLYQLKFAIANNKEVSVLTSNVASLALNGLGEDSFAKIKDMITQAKTGTLDSAPIKKSKEMRFINMFNMVAPVEKASTMRHTMPIGDVFLTAIEKNSTPEITNSDIEGVFFKPNADVKPVSIQQKELSIEARALTVIFNGTETFEMDGDSPAMINDKTIDVDGLIKSGLIKKMGEDDAYTYFKLTSKGHNIVRGLRGEGNLPVGANVSPENVSFPEYEAEGDRLAKTLLSPSAYDGFNDLHWGVAFNENQPLAYAVIELQVEHKQLAKNSSEAMRLRRQAILGVMGKIADDYGEELTKPQKMLMLVANVKEQLSINIDSSSAAHYVTDSYKKLEESADFISDETPVLVSNNEPEQSPYQNYSPAVAGKENSQVLGENPGFISRVFGRK